MNTHGIEITFGKHKGQLITRVPLNYLKWMINCNSQMSDYARAELERRGDTLPTVELSGHAIDNASLRVRKIWHEDRKENEGLYTWLMRVTLEALEVGELKNSKHHYKGMKLVIEQGEEYPVLKTIMRK